jgi:regulator of replication initiation timing
LLRSEIKEFERQRNNLKDEIDSLRAQKYEVLTQLHARQSELEVLRRELGTEKFSKMFNDIFTEDQFT